MGAGSAALIWYACCCSFVAFAGIVATGLVVYGRRDEAKRRAAKQATAPGSQATGEPTEPGPSA